MRASTLQKNLIMWRVKWLCGEHYGNIRVWFNEALHIGGISTEQRKSLPRASKLPKWKLAIEMIRTVAFLCKITSKVTDRTLNNIHSLLQEQCFMYQVSYPSLLMTSLSGLLGLDSRSLSRGTFFFLPNSTFKGGPSENMIGNFRHNLHIISIKIDTAANTGGFWCAFLPVPRKTL